MGKIISISNQKGGVGKTTTTVNLAASLGAAGKKVLIIDLDPQGNTTSGLGFNKKEVEKSSYDVLEKDVSPEEATLKTEFKNLSLIPSHINLAAADAGISLFSGKESKLKNKILELKKVYDFILIDCPPSLGIITINAFCASDSILIPIQCEYYALEGLSQLINTIKVVKRHHNTDLDIEGILMTMCDTRLNLTKQVMAEVQNNFPDKVFKTTIPRSVKLSEAPGFGKPVMYFSKFNKGNWAYKALAKEIIKNNK
ncbi:MAG: ParA family protein [Clostridia bacterium]|nr:ParA family protein [Clostridia bacterium]